MKLEIRDLHVSYGGIRALKGVDLTVEEGQIVTLIGPNGSGKSTILKTVIKKFGIDHHVGKRF